MLTDTVKTVNKFLSYNNALNSSPYHLPHFIHHSIDRQLDFRNVAFHMMR